MQIHLRRFALTAFYCLIFNLKADLPKGTIQKIKTAISEYREVELKYERWFKYPMEKDTLAEIVHSSLWMKDSLRHRGLHNISYLRSGIKRSLVVVEDTQISRLNYRENATYKVFCKNVSVFYKGLSALVFHPFTLTESEWKSFSIARTDDELIYLEQVVKTATNTRTRQIILNKKTWLPVYELDESLNNGKLQYSMYKLLFIEKKDQNSNIQDQLLKKARVEIASGIDVDSVKASRKDRYRHKSIGDTVAMFHAQIPIDQVFNPQVLKDSLVILDFFYTNCAPCMKSIPELNTIYRKFAGMGVLVYGVDGIVSDHINIPAYIKAYGVEYPVLCTDKNTIFDYGVTGFPRLFVIHKGVIVKICYGFTEGLEKELETVIQSLIKS